MTPRCLGQRSAWLSAILDKQRDTDYRHILANLQRFAKNSVRELGGQLGMNDERLEGENIVTVNLYGLGLLIDSQ